MYAHTRHWQRAGFRLPWLWLAFFRRGGPWRREFGGPRGRRFGRGDLKYVILDLLQEGPRHGYDIIRALEERFHGFYSPSPGSVYPTLQLLEDQGYVTSTQQDGKRVYTITDAGRDFLKERSDTVEDVWARVPRGPRFTPEMRDLVHEFRQLAQLLFSQATEGGLNDPHKVSQLRDVIARARREIEGIFSSSSQTPPDEYV
ncbi:MAG TPA: helix-turn-helix transcriptional regulator [Chloroflexota bacterium]|nr:helix-turn-helix transcriptional regulator [Chloroflexota bacterium]